MSRVLFTGGGGAGSEFLYRILGHDCHFADADPDSMSPVIPLERQHSIPLATDPAYCAAIQCLCRELAIDLVVPSVDEELPVIEWLRLFRHVDLLLPDYQYVTVMLDKFGSMKWLRDAGIPVPYTEILKPRYGRGSRGVRVRQQQLEGSEYTVTMCADRQKRLHAIVPVLVLKKRGITLRGRTVDHPEVVTACQRIHEARPTCGTYNIQGVLTGTGFLPFEINPRVSTTTCLAVAAGVDPIAIWYGDEPTGLQSYRVHLELHRSWHNHLA